MENNDYSFLYKKFLNGVCSIEELSLLFDYLKIADEDTLRDLISEQFSQSENTSDIELNEDIALKKVLRKIKSKMHPNKKTITKKSSIQLRFYYSVVAAAVILIISSTLVYFHQETHSEKQLAISATDIYATNTGAILTMANGKSIQLNNEKEGIVMGDRISYNDGTFVEFNSNFKENDASYATLSTPKGGQYNIELPDGSRVWLNAASTIKYPVKFTGNSRRVELTGEAYFEVENAESTEGLKQKSFIVKTNGQEVKVLGTRFNVKSYSDEGVIKTTLLEGSVNVSITNSKHSFFLKPNQQSTVFPENDGAEIATIDPSLAISWKNGLFSFYNTDLHEVMRQISRWYDIDVIYEGTIGTESFYGEIQRSYKLSEVLKVLELGGVKFKIRKNTHGKNILTVTNR